jgi:hypothetical protein
MAVVRNVLRYQHPSDRRGAAPDLGAILVPCPCTTLRNSAKRYTTKLTAPGYPKLREQRETTGAKLLFLLGFKSRIPLRKTRPFVPAPQSRWKPRSAGLAPPGMCSNSPPARSNTARSFATRSASAASAGSVARFSAETCPCDQ